MPSAWVFGSVRKGLLDVTSEWEGGEVDLSLFYGSNSVNFRDVEYVSSRYSVSCNLHLCVKGQENGCSF